MDKQRTVDIWTGLLVGFLIGSGLCMAVAHYYLS